MTQNEKIAEIVSRMKSHFGKGDGGGSNYYIDTYVLDELGKWLTEALSHNGEEVVWTDAKVINFAHFLEAHDELTSNEALQKFKKRHSTPSPTVTPTEDPYKKAFGISSETSLKFLHDAYDENDRLRQMINNENIRYGLALSLCASFITICQRKGEHTNWEAFENQCYEAMGVKKSTLRVEKLPNASSGIITREQLNDGENDMSVINEIALRHLTEWQKLMTEVGDDGVLKDGMKPRPLIQVIINAMEEYRSQHSRQPSPNPLLEEVKKRLLKLPPIGWDSPTADVLRQEYTDLIQFSESTKEVKK